jgi:hypothetical protein
VAWLWLSAFFLVGCGDDGSAAGAASQPGGKTYSEVLVEPIAQRVIEREHPRADVANVDCDSKVMIATEGALTHCTARIDQQPTSWIVTFRDSSGTIRLRQAAGETGNEQLG